MHVATVNGKKDAMNLKKSKEKHMRGFAGKKGKREMIRLYFNFKNKWIERRAVELVLAYSLIPVL